MPSGPVQTPAPAGTQRAGRPWDQWLLNAALPAALLILAGYFFMPALQRRIPVHGDLGNFNLPVREFYARCLKQGDAFDWMPGFFCGYFITGEGQHGPYHPLHWLLYRWLPLDTAFALEIFLPVAVLAAGMIVFLRRFTSFAAACVGAIVATFSVQFVCNMQCPQMSLNMAQLPWYLAAIDGAVGASTAARRRWSAVALALLTASLALLGHPQSFFFVTLTGGLFALWRLCTQHCGWRTWATLSAAVALGLAMGTIQIWSTYSAYVASGCVDSDPVERARQFAPAWEFWSIVAPQLSWWPHYFGAAALLLTLWWVAAVRTPPQPLPAGDATAVRRLSTWAFATIILTFLLALGTPGKLYYLLLYLPVVGKFHVPLRYLAVTQLVLAIPAALAFGRLLALVQTHRRTPWTHLLLPWAAAAASLGVSLWHARHAEAGLWRAFWAADYYHGPVLMVATAAALTLAARGRALGIAILVAAMVVDARTHSIRDQFVGTVYWRNLPTYREFVARHSGPPTLGEGRIHENDPANWNWMTSNQLCLRGARLVKGYVALPPARALDYDQVNSLRVAAVAWFRNPTLHPAGLGPPTSGGWQAVPDPMPRVRLVSTAVPSAQPGVDLKQIDVATAALVSHPLNLPPSAPGTVVLTVDRPGRLSMAADASQRQLLVVSEAYYPEWRVEIDRQPAALERVDGDFMGCVVPAGRHQVDFSFRPNAVRWGGLISLCCLAVTLAWGLVSFKPGTRQNRRSGGGPPAVAA